MGIVKDSILFAVYYNLFFSDGLMDQKIMNVFNEYIKLN